MPRLLTLNEVTVENAKHSLSILRAGPRLVHLNTLSHPLWFLIIDTAL